jgi:hypothetical protein
MASRFPRPFPAAVGVSQHPGGQILPTPAEDPADSNLSISTIVIFYKIYIVLPLIVRAIHARDCCFICTYRNSMPAHSDMHVVCPGRLRNNAHTFLPISRQHCCQFTKSNFLCRYTFHVSSTAFLSMGPSSALQMHACKTS